MRKPGIPNRPYLGDDVVTAVRMSIHGESVPAIAREIHRKPDSVRRVLERAGLKGICCNQHSHGLRTAVPHDAYATLAGEAAVRNVRAEALAADLLTIIARDGLFRSILDL